jgi:hypothetical protein
MPFMWYPAFQNVFEYLKRYCTSVPVMHYFNPERKIMAETDTSNLVIEVVLSSYNTEGILHPTFNFLKKHIPAEINYEIYDKESLTIIDTFKGWYPLLEGCPHTSKVISGHRNFTHFTTHQ